ncbi:MAG: hypothetical protein F3745_09955, partial [Nitrospinae bacterium]|nr:hypothetical protein [Nitrospinota bacterium]
MDKEELPEQTRKNIDSILSQLKKALPLPPSKSFLKATEFAIEKFVEKNIWHIFVSLESVFFNLMEFTKKRGVVYDFKELRKSLLFRQAFLENYRRQYLLFSETFIRERENYISQTQSSNKPYLEINSDAKSLFLEAANLAVDIFKSKTIQGEHLILSFFSPRFPVVQNTWLEHGVIKEKLFYEWILSMNLSVKE